MFEQTKWVVAAEVLYIIVLIFACLRIVYDTRSVSKTLAYLLFAIFVPVIGMIFYFTFGINYRKRKRYGKKLVIDESIKNEFEQFIKDVDKRVSTSHNPVLKEFRELSKLLSSKRAGNDLVLPNLEIRLLINGEELYPCLLQELEQAKEHIHIEYYIYDNDIIGNQVKDILIRKAREGVEVRFIYDDFGSRSIRRNIVKELRKAGVQAFPFNEIKLIHFANRLNYRNHRKIVVIDGKTAFTGGINVSDKYINTPGTKLFWRDTHLMVKGYTALAMQQVFMSDWNFCSHQNIPVIDKYFPVTEQPAAGSPYAQIVSSGPDSDMPGILYSILQSVNLAEEEILITTPYYVPDSSLQENLIIAALSGVTVKMLLPGRGDSRLVDLASQAYYDDLLRAGVRIYQYKKGFVHAKTFVIDRELASVGTANLDVRSFDLNFEVAAMIYDQPTATRLAEIFDKDLLDAEEIIWEKWKKRSRLRKLLERLVRLVSPFM